MSSTAIAEMRVPRKRASVSSTDSNGPILALPNHILSGQRTPLDENLRIDADTTRTQNAGWVWVMGSNADNDERTLIPARPSFDMGSGLGLPLDGSLRTGESTPDSVTPEWVVIGRPEDTTTASVPKSGMSVVLPSQILHRMLMPPWFLLSRFRHSMASLPTLDQTHIRTA